MRRGGIAIAVLVALAGCQSSSDQAEVTTTTGPGTTIVKAATTTTTTTAPKKPAATTTTWPKPASTLPTSEGEEEVEIVVRPEDVEPYVFRGPGSGWVKQQRYDESNEGPVDLDRAAADEAGEDGDAGDARRFLEELGFMAGYARAWDRLVQGASREETSLYARLYFFSTPQGAAAYLKHDAAAFEESTDRQVYQDIYVDIPGARAWSGGNDDDGHLTAVLFTRENFYAQIVCFSSLDQYGNNRTWGTESAMKQWEHLKKAFGS